MARPGGAGSPRLVLYRKLGIPVGWLQETVLTECWQLRLRSVDLASVWRARLIPNGVGGMYLECEDGQGRKAGCHVLVIGMNSARRLAPEALDRLASALARSAAPSADGVCRRLLEQADHLRSGRDVWSSPLRSHSEWIPSGLGSPQQRVSPPYSPDA